MKGPRPFRMGVIGTGWIGRRRALTCASHPLVAELHLADARAEVVEEVAAATGATSVEVDYRRLLGRVDAVIVSSAPETTHYPIARDCLAAGKHILLEKPMALRLSEADDLLAQARESGAKLAVGYTQRFSPRFAYVKACVVEGRLGRPVTALVSRHLTRALGERIAGRGELGPAQMEATHDIDLALWWMEGARPVKVYAQSVDGVMRPRHGLPDCTWIVVTNHDGTAFTVGANWNLPPEAPGFSSAMVGFVGTEGAIFIDDSHRDLLLSTVKGGLTRPLSTMPGEQVGHVYRGPMEAETLHFIEAVARDQPVLVTGEQARVVMEVTLAADLSAQLGRPVELPLPPD
ncbi:MAG TPA: Gfo/Idh/MocA family oxidoreductase [Candidatus Dormibacteraeota bacterium]|nr:Gfo/Idh/MocA family oxidoreductase [Candidatus Dormibacteraeota bacterium]